MKLRALLLSCSFIILITSTSLGLIQTSKNIPSSGVISTPTPPKVKEGFGVNVQYQYENEEKTYFPDLWTLVKFVGATHLIGAPRRAWIDEAANHGLKVMICYGYGAADWYTSKEKMKAHLDKYNIPQYRDHPGVWAHNICIEPPNNYDAETDNRVEVMLYGISYIRSLDPTHPVTISLNPQQKDGREDKFPTEPATVENRKKWISRFIDHIDFLTYNYYRFTRQGTSGGSGTEFWREPVSGFTDLRTALIGQLDQVLIPAAKGKPIVIGEMGCPTGTTIYGATFTEEQQAEYFRIYGEETRKRGIFVCVFKLIDVTDTQELYGLFKEEKGLTMNVPKKAASLVKDYLSILLSTSI